MRRGKGERKTGREYGGKAEEVVKREGWGLEEG